MKLKLITLAVIAGMTSHTASAYYAEEDCKQFGGNQNCVKPSPAKPISQWTYTFDYNPNLINYYPYNHPFNTEQEALAAFYGGKYFLMGKWSPTYTDEPSKYEYVLDYDDFGNKASNTTYYEYNLARYQDRYLASLVEGKARMYQDVWGSQRLSRKRKIQPPICPLGTTTKYFKSSNTFNLPFMCAEPPPPNRCEFKNNNPIPSSCGNPIDFTSGNKTQTETDWQSANSPLKITRIYNSLPIAINMGDNAVAENGWKFQHIGQMLQLIAYDTNNDNALNTSHNASQLFAQSATALSLNQPALYINRPAQAPLRFYYQQAINSSTTPSSLEKIIFKIDNKHQNIQVEAYPDGTWQYIDKDKGNIDWYNQNGQLIKTQYPNGQYLTYSYANTSTIIPIQISDQLGQTLSIESSANQIQKITLPTGKILSYEYDTNGMLASVTRPGYGKKQYVYAETGLTATDTQAQLLKTLMTGIIDENGRRYATFSYDNQGRAITTEHANGAQKYSVQYGEKVIVQSQTGATSTYQLAQVQGVMIPSSTNQENTHATTNMQYDSRGNILAYTKDGINYRFGFDPIRNLETSKIEAFGTPESKITLTEWATNLPIKTKITEGSANPDGTLKQALRITSFSYDDKGNVLTKTITDPQTNQTRTWRYTYNANSQKLTETNPQEQTTTWTYDAKGNLTQSTDAQGLVTTYSDYNLDGKPQTITSPAGQVTKLTYDDAGRVITQTVTITNPTLVDVSKAKDSWIDFQNWWKKAFNQPLLPNPVKYDISKQTTQTATTSYQYDGVGQLITTTLPDGQTITYHYDDAHRMIGMTDSLGNKISYTLNAAGDIIETQNHDPQGQLANRHKQSYDTLGRLTANTGNNGQNQTYGYDNQDNLTQTQDALSRTTASQYDSLKRKIKDVDANGQPVTYTYNALDQLLSVTDSNNVTTSYTYNAFGDVLTTTSPDTGTATNQYNAKGQLISQTDGAGRLQNYAYDDKGRLITRTDGTGKVLASYQYDDKGRISLITDTSGTTAYQYNSNNQVIEKKQTTDGKVFLTRYHYTAGGQLDEELLPSGQLVQYQYDKGILKGVQVKTTDGNSTQVIDSISYSPNGMKGFNWSQTQQTVGYQYDTDGRLTQITDPALQRQYQYDVGNRITNLTDGKASLNALFTHDKLDRLTNQSLIQGQATSQLSYGYDNNGNRTNKTVTANGSTQATATAVKAGTNQYQAYQYDASGKTLTDGVRSYGYNSEGRIATINQGGVSVVNGYNALGQRVVKGVGSNKTYFVYDETGKLLSDGEREFIYLGHSPVAMISSEKPNEVLMISSDHLGTPRAVLNAKNEKLWQWEGDQFGDIKPQIEAVKLPLRHAGQYEDREIALFYNYFRYYDPKTGRYVENDPIDIGGGLNRYGYVGGSPLNYIDMNGLSPIIGEWMKQPELNITKVNYLSSSLISPYLNWWGYVKFFRVNASLSAYINIDVKCSSDCDYFEIHNNLPFTKTGHIDLGPNVYATAIGLRAGPVAAVGANITLAGGSLLHLEYTLLTQLRNESHGQLQLVKALGPTAICQARNKL